MTHADFPPAGSEPLEIAEGGIVRFREFFEDLHSRWIKLERCQHYDESGFDAYEAFLRGERGQTRRLIRRMVKNQFVYPLARERGIEMTRIRVFERPVTSYLRDFEALAYEADEEMGERIFLVPEETARLTLGKVGDFLIFDEKLLVCLVYSQETPARLLSAWANRDPSTIRQYVNIANKLIARSERFSDNPQALS
ncbi:hypothetical protein CSA80_03290 [Candidatus Saccharibacteria bacterium]|nr:MAG: hypothetical protein CSA80_03290 [Candidatus Saccharibacteria bacterium]